MTLLQQQSLELEAIRRNEFKGDLDLLKIMHEKEIIDCRFQIRSLMGGDSTAEYRRDHLEKTTEDLKAVVCNLSLALEKSKETHEKEVMGRLQFMGEFKKLRASAERWADEDKRLSRGWEEARSALKGVKSELCQGQLAAQECSGDERNAMGGGSIEGDATQQGASCLSKITGRAGIETVKPVS